MNLRQKHILRTLISDREISISRCAEEYGVSERTIRYDMDLIDAFIVEKIGVVGIVLKKNNVQFLLDSETAKSILRLDEDNNYYVFKIPSNERVVMIMCDLCWATHYITIQQLADKYCVSRTTINNDLQEIRKWCEEKNIELISKKGFGFILNAHENERKSYLLEIMRNSENQDYARDFIYAQWFRDVDVEKIKQIVTQIEKKCGVWLSDVAFEGLCIHIVLTIKRNETTYKKSECMASIQPDIPTPLYDMAVEIVETINKEFGIELPQEEVGYVAVHLGGKSNTTDAFDLNKDVYVEYNTVALINHVSHTLNLDLRQDNRLYEGLIQHILASSYRYRNHIGMVNPLKDNLIESYPQLYSILKEYMIQKEAQYQFNPSDDEVTYILLHFAASINRNNTNLNRIPNVLIVCSTGLGTSELLSSLLHKVIRVKIQASVAYHQLNFYLDKYPIDLVISTVPIEPTIPHVQVSPILTDEDVQNLREVLAQLGFELAYNERSLSNTLKVLMEQYRMDHDASRLITELEGVVDIITKEDRNHKDRTEDFKLLSELLTEDTISLNSQCTDWEQAIKDAGSLLVNQGVITNEYVEACINIVKESGPYIVITKGVALAHASSGSGVIKTGMSLARLNQPVEFGNKNNDPVKCVFMLATVDSTSHLVALSDLAELLERTEFTHLLEVTHVKGELVKYIQTHETKRKGD